MTGARNEARIPAELEAPEWRLLRLCARREMTAPQVAVLREALTTPPQWEGLLTLAQQHGLLPLLLAHFEGHAPTHFPQAQRERFQSAALGSTAHSLRLAGELAEVLQRLSEAGIPVIPYKGPELAHRAYRDVGLRICGDLDLLVPSDRMEPAGAVLECMGYRTTSALVKRGNDLTYKSTTRAPVELHWRLTQLRNAAHVDYEALWRDAAPSKFLNAPCYRMHVAHLALALAIHGMKHGWARLEWLASFAEILGQAADDDSERLILMARRWRVEKRLLASSQLAHLLLGHPLAPELRDRIGVQHRRLAASALRTLVADASPIARFQLNVRAKDTTRERLQYAGEMLLWPDRTDRELFGGSSFPTPFHPLLRMLRLARKFAQTFRH
jgi:hypothetical protein